MREQDAEDQGHLYARLARLAVEYHLDGRPLPDRELLGGTRPDPMWDKQSACFVSIKGKDGSLRGCIGTFLPSQDCLEKEIVANAISAAVRDPRFPPMQSRELEHVRISVDVLNPPETVTDLAQLDPAIWGVIVAKDGRRGLLLPDLPGVDSVERQIAIAAQKAGITDLEGVHLQRFSVSRHHEE